jgi:hypothetical protein
MVKTADKEITSISAKINKLTQDNNIAADSINSIRNKNIGIEREVGGFRFVADAFGLELNTVVKFFIFIIVIVFDPLAVALIIAFNGLIMNKRKDEIVTTKPHIDEDEVVSYAEDLFDEDIRQNPDVYFSDESRELSPDQEERIERYELKITQIQSMIENLEDEMDGENDDEIEEKIDELNSEIDDLNVVIDDIKENPDGDFPEDLIEDAVEGRVSDVRRDILGFMEDFGLNWDDYVDKDNFIEGVIDADGYGHTINSYDGSADEITVMGGLYYVMRLD